MGKLTKSSPIYAIGIAAYGVLIIARYFAPEMHWAAHHYLATAGLLALSAVKLFRLSTHPTLTRRNGLEAGLLLLICVQIPLQATGGITSPYVPAMYLVIALLAAYTDTVSTSIFVLTAVAFVFPGPWRPMVVYGGIVAAFAFVVGTFVRVERLRRMQAASALDRFQTDADALADELGDPEAEDLRPALKREQERRMREATRALDDSLYNVLDTGRRALEAFSVIYFRYDPVREELRIRQMATDSDYVTEDSLDARAAGLLAGVVKTSQPVTLAKTRGRTLPYYTRSEDLHSAVAVPVFDIEGGLRGVLSADFREEGAGTGLPLLQGFARTLAELERDARERELHATRAHRLAHYFDTSKRLTATLALDEVLSVAISQSQQLASFDFAAIVEADTTSGKLTVRKAEGVDEGRLTGRQATIDGSLVSWVIRNKQYLPVPNFRKREMRTSLLGKRLDPDGIRSALIFPLAREEQTVGAFVIGSLTRDQFDDDEIQLLEGVANQTALAMANAILYLRMQEMATTDGLTGLHNHRYFQESLSKELDRAQRQKTSVALILLDVDHFKRVNDTWGHPVGDQVLRTVAKHLQGALQRTIDLPARYGGEEFVLVLPDTDARGARRVADKVRAAIAKEKFDGGNGETFQVTMSAGIAVYPDQGDHKQMLIDRADKALYTSKEGGRNRTTLWSQDDAQTPSVPRDDHANRSSSLHPQKR